MAVPTRAEPRIDPVALLLAVSAGVWHTVLFSKATNDNFLHLTLAQQLLARDWPVRDFFEHGWVLQYTLSAFAQQVFGYRLVSEGLIVGFMWAVSTYLVFRLVRSLSGLTAAAGVSAVLLIVAGARGYSYPKGIVHAVAATMWWAYIERPTKLRAVAFGAWAAVAFYWRPDHGVYVGAGIVLAMLTAHGIGRDSVARVATSAVTALALITPFLVYVQFAMGLPEYMQTGAVQANAEHTVLGRHEWPVLRFGKRLFEIEAAERYAPTIAIRWHAAASARDRQVILTRYGLSALADEEDQVQRVRLSEGSLVRLRGLLNEQAVEDTAGIDRSTATLSSSAWSDSQRRSFEHWWMRLRLLPQLDSQARASEFAVAWFYLIPVLVMITARWLQHHLSPAATAARLAVFAGFAIIVNLGYLRTPFPARAADAVVLPAVLFGLLAAACWRSGRSGGIRGFGLRGGAILSTALLAVTVAGVGLFITRVNWLAGEWTSLPSARAAWREAHSELVSSPPMTHFYDRPAGVSMRLAAYVRDCLPASERLLVLWFAPEIYYHSERLMAQRHLVFVPGWSVLAHEQSMALEKVRRFAPPLVLARRSAIDPYARASYPGVVDYVEQRYVLADTIAAEGEEYMILRRNDRPVPGRYGERGWPCYAPEPWSWLRVGRPAADP